MKQLSLDLQFFSQEKTEKATPKKRQDTRKKGQVAKSQDVNTAILLFGMFMLFLFLGGFLKDRFTALYTTSFKEYIHWEVTEENVASVLFQSTLDGAIILLPVMVVAIIAGLASNFLQIGFLFSTEPLQFKLSKIDPIQGAKKIFSVRAIVELLKSLLKISFIGTVTFVIIWLNKDDMMIMSLKGIDQAISFFGQMTVIMGITASLVLLFLSVLDFLYQRHDHEKNIKMSKQDLKDEHKNTEGDPLIKSKFKERQRQMAMSRMMSDVPDADVIITNPTHYSIAIKYDEKKFDAPYVVAKGVDFIAFRIREVAKHHDVAIVENRPLARSLYDKVDIGEAINEDFYQAVAEVLAYVYRIQSGKQ
ncbi:flagellar biosynthesis protein FlhB [Salinibacillus xinjiangensis]|uniref:Flagellar biosynthetic protein FlhB n=1 Tax=Salinibacillus xinjiangensis TaxID=1229268 RepID=A0A6G1X356_9BACI|nr:flagellar biosynthesis protein FlhB [Salinibacillus xinjiangensis]MRG85384.1 flagellar biosynthesis protein FlhB [Salinibacillus xinjiangensis]